MDLVPLSYFATHALAVAALGGHASDDVRPGQVDLYPLFARRVRVDVSGWTPGATVTVFVQSAMHIHKGKRFSEQSEPRQRNMIYSVRTA